MSHMVQCRAATLRAVLCYIDPEHTPKIAYDKDEYSEPLIRKVKEAVGERDGSDDVFISFQDDEHELARQFAGVCKSIGSVMDSVVFCMGGDVRLGIDK